MKVRDALKTLSKEGWVIIRQTGSHRQLRHPVKPGTVTMEGTPSDDIPIGTLKSIGRQAGWR